MIELGIARQQVETRAEGGGYTSLVIDGLQSRYGRSGAISSASGAVQAAAGLWARSLAACRSDHPLVDAAFLSAVGYDLGVEGETLWTPVVGPRGLSLARASSWTVYGTGTRPDTWEYDCVFAGPTGQTTIRLEAQAVLHVRYLPDARRPHRGVAPWRRAPRLAELAAEVEIALRDETRQPIKTIQPVPTTGADEDGLARKIKGKLVDRSDPTMVPETTASGWGAGKADAPARDWRPESLHVDPQEGLVRLCRDVPAAVGIVYGVPPVLMNGAGVETVTREAWRRFAASTIGPIARLTGEVLTAGLGEPVALDVRPLRAWDTAGQARAYHVLRQGGMSDADASEAAGLNA